MKPEHQIALALVHRAGRWLVAQRRRDAHLGGLWEFPGGKCEEGETPRVAALRELMEECGVRAEPETDLAVVSCEYPERMVHLAPVVCRWTAGEARPLASDGCRWVTIDELGALEMPEVNARFIRQIVRLRMDAEERG